MLPASAHRADGSDNPEPAFSSFDVLCGLMSDPDAQWSAGTFGAIAEFSRDAGETTTLCLSGERISAATSRGAIALQRAPEVRLVAYETVSSDPSSWRHGLALCLPEAACAMNRRTVLTELGADADAVRSEDRMSLLFDLGLDLLQTDACIRTSDPALIAVLRKGLGKPIFEAGNPALHAILSASPHRAFVSRAARVEVYQKIPQAHGKSPEGPHTHILPKLLRARRTHAATTPIPSGWLPYATVYPAHAVLDGSGHRQPYASSRQLEFERLLEQYGDQKLCSLQSQVRAGVASGQEPQSFILPADRFARASVRVALRKLAASGSASTSLKAWIAHFDRPQGDDGEEEEQHAC